MIREPPGLAQVVTSVGTFTTDWIGWIASVYLICRSNTESGTTAQRPTKNLWVGRRYYDTTLGYPVWVHQVTPVVWHNGAGASV